MNKKSLIKIVLGVVVLVGVIGVGYWVYNRSVTIVDKDGKEIEVKAADYRDLKKLQSIYDLPNDIVPLIATVEDAEKLKKEQPGFFAKAVNGMRVFVYPNEAILFDIKACKIMHIGDVNIEKPSTYNFAIYNGSKTPDVQKEFAKTLSVTFNNAKATVFADAKGSYEKTIIVDLTAGKNKDLENIAAKLGAKIVPLPQGEIAPKDVIALIIVGEDYAEALNKK